MEGRVAKDGVEFALERQALCVAEPCVDTARSRRFNERRRSVDADDVRARGDDALRERAVAATDIENPLAGLRREEIDQRRTEVGDEARITRVAIGFPDDTRSPRLLRCGKAWIADGRGHRAIQIQPARTFVRVADIVSGRV